MRRADSPLLLLEVRYSQCYAVTPKPPHYHSNYPLTRIMYVKSIGSKAKPTYIMYKYKYRVVKTPSCQLNGIKPRSWPLHSGHGLTTDYQMLEQIRNRLNRNSPSQYANLSRSKISIVSIVSPYNLYPNLLKTYRLKASSKNAFEFFASKKSKHEAVRLSLRTHQKFEAATHYKTRNNKSVIEVRHAEYTNTTIDSNI